MSRVIFDNTPAAPVFNPVRADIACFVGLIRLLPGATLSTSMTTWLQSLGYSSTQINSLTNVPVLIEQYGHFTSIFDDGSVTGDGTDYLAAAVRSFFAQGAKRCYVVRVDDPLLPSDTAMTKALKLAAILPNINFAPDNPATWTGVTSLGVLEDVSFLLIPDLPVLCASQPIGAVGQTPTPPTGPEEFVVCSQGDITPQPSHTVDAPAPTLQLGDYATWADSVASILNYLASGITTYQLHLREIQFVAAFPIPQEMGTAAAAENPSSSEIAQDIHAVITAQMPENIISPGAVPTGNISSSFLQLAYPWLKTSGSGALLDSLEPPDGALVGLLARNALTRGTFTSATKITPAEVYDVYPPLPAQEMQSSAQPLVWGAVSGQQKALIERLSLFGFTPTGLRLLSDVTAYPDESYRYAPVNRLVSVICRAARHMGETVVFQSNGPALWGRVQRFLQNLMTRLWTLNALDGDSAADAFSVRCDQTTMNQNDLDNGRIIAYVTFTAASLIETITVKLALETSGTSAQEISANMAGVS
jgi:Bacteriophage tail sheath protein